MCTGVRGLQGISLREIQRDNKVWQSEKHNESAESNYDELNIHSTFFETYIKKIHTHLTLTYLMRNRFKHGLGLDWWVWLNVAFLNYSTVYSTVLDDSRLDVV